jgi:hypothetical protein
VLQDGLKLLAFQMLRPSWRFYMTNTFVHMSYNTAAGLIAGGLAVDWRGSDAECVRIRCLDVLVGVLGRLPHSISPTNALWSGRGLV